MSNSETVLSRRDHVAQLWALDDEIVLIGSGAPLPIPGGADRCYPFHTHPHFQWLTGLRVPHSFVAFDPHEGWTEFLHRPDEAEQLWEGAAPVSRGRAPDELPQWLADRMGRPLVALGAGTLPPSTDLDLAHHVESLLLAARRPKDEEELSLLRRAGTATRAGFLQVPQLLESAPTERALQIELEATFFRAGAEQTGYDTIVAAGTNGAILHFPPSARALRPGDTVLIDAGASVEGYVADITRVFPIGGAFTPEQQAVYDVVLHAQQRAIPRCVPGTEWREVHLATARDLAEGLQAIGVLRTDPQRALESGALSIFFPHGVGHLVGLGVRDAAPLPTETPQRYFGVGLRIDMPLPERAVVTVEPGVYFNPLLLERARSDRTLAPLIDWHTVQKLQGIGGVRIEDNVLVLAEGPELLSQIPK